MFKAFTSLSLAFAVYSYYNHPFQLKNPLVSSLFRSLSSLDPSYSSTALKILLKSKIFKPSTQLNDFVLDEGFDIEGNYLRQVQLLGFKGIQVGPISYNSTRSEEKQQHMGIMYSKAMIRSFRKNNPQSKMKIGVSVKADEDVLEYAPYILKQNIVSSVEQLCEDTPIHYIAINMKRVEQNLKEYPAQIEKLKRNIMEESQKLQQKGVQIYMKEEKNTVKGDKKMRWQELIQFIKSN